MSDNLVKYKGKNVIIYTKNNFRIEGKIKECDEKFVEIFDNIKNRFKIVNVDNISEVEVRE